MSAATQHGLFSLAGENEDRNAPPVFDSPLRKQPRMNDDVVEVDQGASLGTIISGGLRRTVRST
jgi:hypothetical protein